VLVRVSLSDVKLPYLKKFVIAAAAKSGKQEESKMIARARLVEEWKGENETRHCRF
jgi:hypothetical protein